MRLKIFKPRRGDIFLEKRLKIFKPRRGDIFLEKLTMKETESSGINTFLKL